MVGRQSGDIVMKHLHKYLSVFVRKHFRSRMPSDQSLSTLVDVVVYSTVSSLLALTTWWFDHDLPHTAERMNEIFTQLTRPGVEAILKRANVPGQESGLNGSFEMSDACSLCSMVHVFVHTIFVRCLTGLEKNAIISSNDDVIVL